MFARRTLASFLAMGGLIAATGAALAAWPDKAVNYIIPFNPGGESDITARMQQPVFQKMSGQDLVVQYVTGAGGAAAWSQLNAKAADGSVIMGTNLPHIILQPLQDKNVGYQTDDIHNVYMFQYTPDALLVPADSPHKTLDDFIAAAKQAPGATTLSGSGTFSGNHLAKEIMDRELGIKTTYIPFSGTAPAVTALLGNQVQAQMGYTTIASQQSDKLRMLAVAMEERHPAFPDVPTFKELGHDIVSGVYRGVAVPAGTPEETKKEISAAFEKVNQDPELRRKMEQDGFVLVDIGHDEMADFMAKQKAQYTEAAKAAGLLK